MRSYVGLLLAQSIDRDLPLWFHHGFAAVLSNTLVRDDHVLLGAPIPWNLQVLRERPLLPLSKLLAVTRQSPDASRRSAARSSTPKPGRSSTS